MQNSFDGSNPTKMPFDLLISKIRAQVELDSASETLLRSKLGYKKIRRRQFFLQEGEINRHASFCLSGCLRLYAVDKNGFEHILQFAPAGWWIGDMSSFLRQSPATLNIDAVFDSELALLPKAELNLLYEKIPQLEHFFRLLAENAIAAYQHRLTSNLSLSAKERYLGFCSLYPSLIQEPPQKLIASYIGVTPEFLSKMLKQPMNGQ
jgi:CRP-like cAMP-binding protein